MDRSRIRYLPALAVLLILSGFVVACGDDDGTAGLATATPGQSAATQSDPTQEPDAAAQSSASSAPEPEASPAEEPIPTTKPASEPTQPPANEETNDDPLPEPDNPAPEIITAGDWYNSVPLSLAEMRGEPVLLVFWATI